ncbi:MAG: heavy-metal-associated domain-containing protein [Altibacter sp.]|uniref:heavy-metal-associated domain-containing protein n=1 Tax=Altibacter sp. TaxID=2024823 RepID=UPI001DA17398|nr:heavy-metal-associated domain-containing protein [Altibacter sp.]MBZ0327423.1 heavy-metal-associated domain-containing protein [Altibacter sp.]
MKKVLMLLVVVLTTATLYSQDKNARATIEVDGICGMCKQRIERASLNTKGVKSAVWNVDTHMLNLIFDERKTNITAIQTSIASVGHDTHEIKATEEAYNSVHDCCRYRDQAVRDDH